MALPRRGLVQNKAYLLELLEDTSPQFGGDVDVNGNKIVSTSNGNIVFDPHGTGTVVLLAAGGEATSTFSPTGGAHALVLENANEYTQLALVSDSDYGGFFTSGNGSDDTTWMGWYGSANAYFPGSWEVASSEDWGFYDVQSSVHRLRIDSKGSIFQRERAAAGTDVAGYGQLWVKNTTPCQLWFTDDAGTDTRIV